MHSWFDLYDDGVAWSCYMSFFKYSTNIDSYTHTSTYSYEYMYIYLISISTSKRLSQLDLKIYKVGHQERLTVDGDIVSN
jgi:hypothetical protein